MHNRWALNKKSYKIDSKKKKNFILIFQMKTFRCDWITVFFSQLKNIEEEELISLNMIN